MRMWSDSPQVLRQIEGIGPKKLAQLANSGITSIEKLRNASTGKIEALCDRHPPFGLQVKQRLRNFPILRIAVNKDNRCFRIEIEQTMAEFQAKRSVFCTVLVGQSKEKFLLRRELKLTNGTSRYCIDLKECPNLTATSITVAAILDSISGSDIIIQYPLGQNQKDIQLEELHSSGNDTKKCWKSKHEQSLEEQSKIMRSSLTQPANKKMRITTPSTPQIDLTNAISAKLTMPAATKTEKVVQATARNRLPSVQSNIGYSRPALGIRSVKVENISEREKPPHECGGGEAESFELKLQREFSDVDFAIDTLVPVCQEATRTYNGADFPNYDCYQRGDVSAVPKQTSSYSNLPKSINRTASEQVAIKNTGGSELRPSSFVGQNVTRRYDPSSLKMVNICQDGAPKQAGADRSPTATGFDFCDERLVYSSLFDD